MRKFFYADAGITLLLEKNIKDLIYFKARNAKYFHNVTIEIVFLYGWRLYEIVKYSWGVLLYLHCTIL